MLSGKTIGVVIPCYKVRRHILQVVETVPSFADHIIVVDDRCPEDSGRLVEETAPEKTTVLRHDRNTGVGGAVVSGYKKALELGCDLVVKIDGDGQMDPERMEELVAPLLSGAADYAKGNRFRDLAALRSMPPVRLFGNSLLSFMVKASSGYWQMMDPTNGYTAITAQTLEKLDLDRLEKRYFFESDMLIRLNLVDAVVADVSIPARYGDEESSLSIRKTLFTFPGKLFKGMVRRIFFRYFLYDFNMASVYLITGVPMVLWGLLFGGWRWYLGAFCDVFNTTGTVMVAVLPLILGAQFLIAAVNIDIAAAPARRPSDSRPPEAP